MFNYRYIRYVLISYIHNSPEKCQKLMNKNNMMFVDKHINLKSITFYLILYIILYAYFYK